MRAILTGGLNCGLGSVYDTLYRLYNTQEFLKKLKYSVKICIDFSHNHFKIHNEDREFIKKIFNFNLFDDIEIFSSGFNPHEENLKGKSEFELVLNKDRIFYVHVDEKVDGLSELETFDGWQTRDNLPKICILNESLINSFEKRLENFKEDFVVIHYRPFEYLDQEEFLNLNKEYIDSIISENKNKQIFLSTSFEVIKSYFREKKDVNLLINDYNFSEYFEIRTLNLEDDELVKYLTEMSFEMYLMSKSSKVYRVGCSWFSNFLFLSSTFNQTSISNTVRYLPNF